MRKKLIAGLVASGGLLLLIAVLALPRSSTPSADKGRGGSVWGAGYFPNVPLVNHEGKTVHFFEDLIKDKVVVINFIYTSCPDSCPLETARLQQVQRILGDRVGKDVFFYSITIDPERDTPERLAEYVRKFRLGPGWWFLTGAESDVTLLRKKLGVYIPEIQKDGSNDHNLSLVIGNQKTGRWMRRSPFENPYVLATQLGAWLHNWKAPSQVKREYADAPQLRRISAAEDLFRTRCASCHTVGLGDVKDPERQLVGPDLHNVTRQRDRQWLIRWLMEPDKMLAEKDPLALSLFARYEEVPMPNLKLGRQEAEMLLAYLDEESRRIDRSRLAEPSRGASGEAHDGHHGSASHAGHKAGQER